MGIETTLWDPADHLDSVEAVVAYVEAALEIGDPELVFASLTDVARSLGKDGSSGLSSLDSP